MPRLTAIMTSRFILDLHEAADPRFDASTAAGSSTLVFPVASKHAPRFDSDMSFGAGTTGSNWFDQSEEGDGPTGVGIAECDNSEWGVSPIL
ncbi:hypothetical protein TRAPUB_9163 [Trametes pubescens]|uniref:Uncharacterized protein n=1 Tax=Trametes pubescens TaxID=154538 RepID=A0A1M2W3C9_TRAPU|nr:hypothetical protein TRAPUB_9163 [Trametes pubescens]